ncbi:uncharacterized protein LOC117168766 [Belonocnema kinseyi]|uniref:uncharacterized protein LOC117168766 n=1 Tax=Belonocnema kinseyi TaxID=2817044 RepID=UPI00143D222F|nr:uncharacterized protein LOC117168766 [Belonocnema kinseyi]
MKIYISGLSLTLVVILHIHGSSSMYPQNTGGGSQAVSHLLQALHTHVNEEIERIAPKKFPNESSNGPIPFYNFERNLALIRYAGRDFILEFLETEAGELANIHEGTYLYRLLDNKRKGKRIAVYNNHQFISLNGCCFIRSLVEPQTNDFLESERKPYGWISPNGLLLFKTETAPVHATGNAPANAPTHASPSATPSTRH